MNVVFKIYYALGFLAFYGYKLIESNVLITWDILTPKDHTKPAVIEVPLIIKKPLGILLCNNLISMTPGTLSIDIDKEHKSMLLHVLFSQNEEKIRGEVAYIQERVQKITD